MERPRTILVIGNGETFRYGFFNNERKSATPKTIENNCEITRICLNAQAEAGTARLRDLFQDPVFRNQQRYDLVLVADLFELLPVDMTLKTLEILESKARKQVLALLYELCPEEDTITLHSGRRRYHPVVFKDRDFSYLLLGKEHENRIQIYSFFPSRANRAHCQKHPLPPLQGIFGDKKLRLAYILPDQSYSDAAKQLLIQAGEMQRRGHFADIYLLDSTAPQAIPAWSHLQPEDVDHQYVLKPNEDLFDFLGETDAAVICWMEQVETLEDLGIPLVLWEHGSHTIFGDYPVPQASQSPHRLRLQKHYQPPVHLLSASPLIQSVLRARFARNTHILPAAVRDNAAQPPATEKAGLQILIVGDGQQEFENFAFVIKALEMAARQGEVFHINWATPTQPVRDLVPKGMRVEYHIAPTAQQMDELYAGADIFLSHSLYDGFPLPPLEAMAAGTAVLAIGNGGIECYALAEENCLLCPQGDLDLYTQALLRLMQEEDLRARLAAAGQKTAQAYTPQRMAEEMEQFLYHILK